MPTIRIANIDYPVVFRGGVFCHPEFIEDFRDILERSGLKGVVAAKFLKQLEFLDVNGRNAPTLHSEWFEQLANMDGLYSIRIKCKASIRILFDFFQEKPVLLCCFLKTARAQAGANSYQAAKPIAQRRFRELRYEEE